MNGTANEFGVEIAFKRVDFVESTCGCVDRLAEFEDLYPFVREAISSCASVSMMQFADLRYPDHLAAGPRLDLTRDDGGETAAQRSVNQHSGEKKLAQHSGA